MNYEKNLILVLLFLSLGIAACGKNEGSNSVESSSVESSSSEFSSTEPSSDTVVGPCTLAGNIRSFQVNCTKTIQSFGIGFITVGKKLKTRMTINGTQYDTDITNNGTSLVGSENLADSLDIVINFTDSSTASVTLRSK